jgi:hypothetical protein
MADGKYDPEEIEDRYLHKMLEERSKSPDVGSLRRSAPRRRPKPTPE